MAVRTSKYIISSLCGLVIGVAGYLPLPVDAQGEAPLSAVQFDPSDVYLQGYLASRSAESLTKAGDHIRAAEQYRKADELLSTVRKFYPDWKPQMVERRYILTSNALLAAQNAAEAQLNESRSMVAELEGGQKVGGELIPGMPSGELTVKKPNILEVDPILMRRLAEAEAEANRLKDLVARQHQDSAEEAHNIRQQALNDQAKAEAEIESLENMARAAEAETNKKVRQLKQLAAMAHANAQAEVNKIKQLTGNEKTQAEAELARLRQVADQANANAEAEINRIERLTAKADAVSQAKIAKLKQLSAKSQAEAVAELERLRQLTAEIQASADTGNKAQAPSESQNQTQINKLTLSQSMLQQKLQMAEANVNKLRSRLASAPLQNEMESLNQKIKKLEEERRAMAMSLHQSNDGFSKAKGRIAALEAELKETKQKSADLLRDLGSEREIANTVVAGQRQQLNRLTQELEEKSKQLTAANNTITGLRNELEQSHDAFEQLRDERDSLLVERDQMAALLKLNEDGRIQDLIEQNMSLAKELRESKEKLDRLYIESNADKDSITEALRDLAIAKSQINSLRADKKRQDERLAALESKLTGEQIALAEGTASADPAEVAVLRDIIKRQLRLQKRRRQARDLLIAAFKDLSKLDPQLAEAVKILDSPSIVLTPEEQKLVADRQVDGEFVSPFARNREMVDRATNALERNIAVFDRAAKKAFISGRLLPTRELYEMILDQHPGHTPTLCKIGVVYLKLDDTESATDSFRRAIELDTQNSYAYRMFGYCLMQSGEIEDAEKAVRKSIDLDPNDGKAHILLGSLCYQQGRANEAESHFKGAINADPLPSEPYYNLAVICSRSGRLQQAQEYYQKALKRGAIPDNKLEDEIAIR